MGRQKIAIEYKICPGCGESNPKKASYCNSCQVSVNSYKLNGWAHYHKLELSERKEAIKFIDKIRNQNGFLTLVDMFMVIHYYQLTHKLSMKYSNYITEHQIWFFFIDLLIWDSKQKGSKMPFNKMLREDIYKTSMTKNETKSPR